MGRRMILGQGARATIAVAALYALVLQAFLTGLLPIPGAQAHGLAELCAPMGGEGGPAKSHDAKGCCTAACMPLAFPVPMPGAAAAAWPARLALRVVFTPALPPPARGPPPASHSARGPPTA